MIELLWMTGTAELDVRDLVELVEHDDTGREIWRGSADEYLLRHPEIRVHPRTQNHGKSLT